MNGIITIKLLKVISGWYFILSITTAQAITFVEVSDKYSFWGFRAHTPQGYVLNEVLPVEYKDYQCERQDKHEGVCGYLYILMHHLKLDVKP